MPSVAGDQSIIVESINDAQAKPDLLVLGAISDGMALPGGDRPASKPSTKKPTTKKTAPGKPAPKKPVAKKTAPKRPAAKKTARKTARSGAGKAGPKKTGRASPATRKAKPVKKARGATRTRRTMAMAQRASVVRSARAAQSTRSAKPAKPARPAKPAKPAKPTGTAKSGSSAKAPQPKRAIYTNPKAPKVLMVRAAAIGAFDLIGDWEQEMLKYGQAIIHDKIVVIDPLSDDCVVITGSHNLGYKASYANDENMLIIHGNKALAAAYAVHVLDVYDHYKFRAILEQQAFDRATKGVGEKPKTGQGILQVDDGWQDGYLDGSKGQEGEYFLGATPA
jgi:hypothetical protein